MSTIRDAFWGILDLSRKRNEILTSAGARAPGAVRSPLHPEKQTRSQGLVEFTKFSRLGGSKIKQNYVGLNESDLPKVLKDSINETKTLVQAGKIAESSDISDESAK